MHAFTCTQSADLVRGAMRSGAALLPACPALDSVLGILFSPVLGILPVPMFILLGICFSFLFGVDVLPQYVALLRGKSGKSWWRCKYICGRGREPDSRLVLQMRAFGRGMGFGPDWVAPLFSLCRDSHPSAVTHLGFCAFYRLLTMTFYVTRRSIFSVFLHLCILPPAFPDWVCYLHIRTCWLDDALSGFLEKSTRGGGGQVQVVALGAGYDSRAYWFRGARFFQLNTHGTQQCKVQMLDKLGIDRRQVTLAPVDIKRDCWMEALCNAGFDRSVPTFFILEGVSFFLTSPALDATLSKVMRCAAGCIVCFDYFTPAAEFGPSFEKAMKRIGEPFKFAMSNVDSDVAAFLARRKLGLKMLEHIKSEVLKLR
jgi:methyltransferase (TIGR00027 family)